MSEPAIAIGDKLHIITRRRFENDLRRHFVGEVIGISGDLQLVQGFGFVFVVGANEFHKLPEQRTRLFSLGQDGLIVNKIPSTVAISSLEYRVQDRRLVVTDGKHFALDINEFGGAR